MGWNRPRLSSAFPYCAQSAITNVLADWERDGLREHACRLTILFLLETWSLQPLMESDGTDTVYFRTANVAGLNHAALEYFAASIVWRAQFLPRNPISLGVFDTQFRDYLLGVGSFPKAATLLVAIRHRSNLTQDGRLVAAPSSEEQTLIGPTKAKWRSDSPRQLRLSERFQTLREDRAAPATPNPKAFSENRPLVE